MSGKAKRIDSYEVFRVLFILLMVFHHIDMFYDQHIPSITQTVKNYAFEGFVGLNFFFILSGLGCSLGYRERLIRKETSVGKFLYRRLAMLWPVHILFVFFALWIYADFYIIGNFFKQLFMVETLCITQNFMFSYNYLSWCISNLVFFYIIYCFLYKLSFIDCFRLSIVLFIIVVINTISSHPNNIGTLLYINPYFRLLEFVSGITLGLYLKEYKPKTSVLLQCLSLLVFGVMFYLGVNGIVAVKYRYSLYYLFPLLFLLYAFYSETNFSKMLFSSKMLLSAAKYSIVIYLCHQEFFFVIKTYFPTFVTELYYEYFLPAGLIISMFAIVVFSFLVNKFFVAPIYAFLLKYEDNIFKATKL